MKIRPIYFALFLTTASAYLADKPGRHESPLISNIDTAKVAPSPNDLKSVASHGMLGATDDLLKRLTLGSDYAVARHPEEPEDSFVAEEMLDAVVIEELMKEIIKLEEELVELQEEAEEIIVAKQQLESGQEQITPTKVKAKGEAQKPARKVKLTIVEDYEEEEDVAIEEMIVETEVEAVQEPIVTSWDEAEDEEVEEESTPVVMENEHVAPNVQEQAEPPAVEEVPEEPLPFSPYSREQMTGFSAVDDFSAKFDEKLPRRLVSNYRLDFKGRRVNAGRGPAFVIPTPYPNPQAAGEPPSGTAADHQESFMKPTRPAGQRMRYLPHEYSSECWFDTKSKVTAAVYGKKDKKTTTEERSSAMEVANVNTQGRLREATSFQPAVNWFDAQSKVTDAIYKPQTRQQEEARSNEQPTLQEKNRKAATGESAYFSNRYSYDNWHENPKSNNLFMREGHIE